MAAMTSPSATENFNTFLDRELSDRERERFEKRNDDKYIVRKRPRHKIGLIDRIIRRMT